MEELGPAEMAAARWAWEKGEAAGAGTGTLPNALWTFYPLQGVKSRSGVAAIEPQSGAGTGEVSGKAPNIVLLTLDTTRADHLGSAGWTFASTPNLDALAGRGVRFDRCDSAAPITLPAHATIL